MKKNTTAKHPMCDICKKSIAPCRESRSGLLVCKKCDGDDGPNKDSLEGKVKCKTSR